MSVAGYVLAGGNSTRMGTDKALLQIDGVSLVQHTAAMVQRATGCAINWQAPHPHVFQNINTPEEWNRYVNGWT